MTSSTTQEPAHGTLERVGLTALAYPPFVTFLAREPDVERVVVRLRARRSTRTSSPVTGSAQDVGFASFVYSLPGALFMLHAGLLTDRYGAKSPGRDLAVRARDPRSC